MFFKASKWLTIFTLCATLGFHWYALQSVAWVGMIVNYSRQGSIKEAMCKTFDGRHPCPLCKLIRAGKKSEKKSEAPPDDNKIDLFAGDIALFDFPPLPAPAFPSPLQTNARTDTPLVPPPRPFFG